MEIVRSDVASSSDAIRPRSSTTTNAPQPAGQGTAQDNNANPVAPADTLQISAEGSRLADSSGTNAGAEQAAALEISRPIQETQAADGVNASAANSQNTPSTHTAEVTDIRDAALSSRNSGIDAEQLVGVNVDLVA